MTSRFIYDHMTNTASKQLSIEVMDHPGAGGANHLYMIRGFNSITNVSGTYIAPQGVETEASMILFQNGPIPENGVNGVTQEALLAIVIDQLRSFQAGPFACRENAVALTHIETGLMWLHSRTLNRERRGVEGTHKL